ncbi:DHHA1 domain-containing protein [Rossellomorea oryzaecorticis]|uniref:DHHA1 domain-containing protein n=1 Tax=Rossellomorea oryzaecorticis TaxID=1396505 RepID=A0ABU9KC16_9BACI
MTKKYYYEDAYLTTFETTISHQGQEEDGRWFVLLEQTAFYPTGGGQPFDEGVLNGIPVNNVEEVDGQVRHYIDNPFENPSANIKGEIDWNRRYDHMRQHSGQHILSAAFAEAHGYETISFHLGKEILTIDLDVAGMTEEEALQAEDLANKIIGEARPIETKWMTADEAATYPLRKQLSVAEDVRLVIIPGFDYNGCGGTHPRFTSEVGAIKILDWEKHKGHIRLQFVCGSRVLAQLHQKHQVIKELTGILQAPQDKMEEAAQQLLEKMKTQDKEMEEMKQKLLTYEAKELSLTAIAFAEGSTFMQKAYQNRPIQELQKLARQIISDHDEAVVFLAVQNGDKLQLVGAKGKQPDVHLKELAPKIFSMINGKGGGKEDFIQGGGEAALSPEELINHIQKLLL